MKLPNISTIVTLAIIIIGKTIMSTIHVLAATIMIIAIVSKRHIAIILIIIIIIINDNNILLLLQIMVIMSYSFKSLPFFFTNYYIIIKQEKLTDHLWVLKLRFIS